MYRVYTETRDGRERVETAPDETTALRFVHLNKMRMPAAIIAIIAPDGVVTLHYCHDAARADDDGNLELAAQLRAKTERDLQFLRDDPGLHAMTDHFANARRALRRVLAHSTAPNADALTVARRYFDAMTGVTDPEFVGADPAFAARKVMLLLSTASDLADIDAVGIVHQLAPEHTIAAAEFADRGYMDVATFRALTAVITAKEAAETFGLSRQAITQAIENGRLPARQTSGGGWLILRRDAEELWAQDRAAD